MSDQGAGSLPFVSCGFVPGLNTPPPPTNAAPEEKPTNDRLPADQVPEDADDDNEDEEVESSGGPLFGGKPSLPLSLPRVMLTLVCPRY
jgi:hypothetical protein